MFISELDSSRTYHLVIFSDENIHAISSILHTFQHDFLTIILSYQKRWYTPFSVPIRSAMFDLIVLLGILLLLCYSSHSFQVHGRCIPFHNCMQFLVIFFSNIGLTFAKRLLSILYLLTSYKQWPWHSAIWAKINKTG